jgi:hypothetical protein
LVPRYESVIYAKYKKIINKTILNQLFQKQNWMKWPKVSLIFRSLIVNNKLNEDFKLILDSSTTLNLALKKLTARVDELYRKPNSELNHSELLMIAKNIADNLCNINKENGALRRDDVKLKSQWPKVELNLVQLKGDLEVLNGKTTELSKINCKKKCGIC